MSFLTSRTARIGLASALAGYALVNPRLRTRLLSVRNWRRAMYLGSLLLVARPEEHQHKD